MTILPYQAFVAPFEKDDTGLYDRGYSLCMDFGDLGKAI